MHHRIITSAARAAAFITIAGLAAGDSHAQTTFTWTAGNGLWSDTSHWSPAGSPGAGTFLDAASIAAPGSYEVTFDVFREIAELSISNSSASLRIQAGRQLTVSSSVIGPGRIIIDADVNSGTLFVLDGVTIINTNIMLNDDLAGPIMGHLFGPTVPGEIATIGSDATVSGRGGLIGLWNNEGLITVSNPDDHIVLFNPGGELSQSATGKLRTDNNGVLQSQSLTINGGTLECSPTGILEFHAVTATNLAFEGALTVQPDNSLNLGHGNTYTAPIRVQGDFITNPGILRVLDGVTIHNADITLDAPSASRAFLVGGIGVSDSAIIGSTSTVRGTGRIGGNWTSIDGTVAPGSDTDAGTIDNNSSGLILADSSVLDIDVFSLTEYDKITGGPTTVGGTLRARLKDGYIPNFGDRFTVVSNVVSGHFDDLDLPVIGDSLFRIARDAPGEVQLIWTCYADVDPNAVINIDDVQAFVDAFLAGDLVADCVRNGTLNLDDIDCFISNFLIDCD